MEVAVFPRSVSNGVSRKSSPLLSTMLLTWSAIFECYHMQGSVPCEEPVIVFFSLAIIVLKDQTEQMGYPQLNPWSSPPGAIAFDALSSTELNPAEMVDH